ncbi:MAG TPA: Uma2 family endonuclease [Pyrinomonadaceae bacterium]|nr:Uma2 family endonuclease [Pyrinomonadaceae bacterium]
MSALPQRKLFTVDEYDTMIKAGVFDGKERVELIEGEFVKKMTQGDLHIGCINFLTRFFSINYNENVLVSIQNAVKINIFSAPEPDVALLRFRSDFYSTGKAQPEDILLLIEVADSTVSSDRRVKIPLYAGAEVPEVWLVNLPRKIIEIYTEPKNGKYQIVRKATKSETISPKMIADLSVKVADVVG